MMWSLQTRRKREICKRQITMEEGRERKGFEWKEVEGCFACFYSLTYRERSDNVPSLSARLSMSCNSGRSCSFRTVLHTHDLRVSCKVTFNLSKSGAAFLKLKVQPFHNNVISLSQNVALLTNSNLGSMLCTF